MDTLMQRLTKDTYADNLEKASTFIGRVYSYIVYRVDGGYTVQYNVHEDDNKNTLDPAEFWPTIVRGIEAGDDSSVVCYGQPSLDVITHTFGPLIHRLAKDLHRQWSQYRELEDIEQECWLVVCELYGKGYYLHKRLVERACYNNIVKDIRRDRPFVNSVSLDSEVNGDPDLCLGDIIPDTSYIDEDAAEAKRLVREGVRDYVVELWGQRRYDQLVLTYKYHTTDANSQKAVMRLRERMAREGVTVDTILYGGAI